ncbi:MAG: aromatic amino acid lyase [Spongiibacteraceae bacterium]|nr:aromatic amino acid lyase [Spongiibacteraceae bacterium]
MSEKNAIVFGENCLTIDDIIAIAQNYQPVKLSEQKTFREKIIRGAQFLDRLLEEEGVIYGVTTGYGDSCTVSVPPHLVEELPVHLSRFHGCGMGEMLSPVQVRAVMAVRLVSLSYGYSGVRFVLLEKIQEFINNDIVPVIPQEGSVGASGDLTPLSYLAAALMGEREVIHDGQRLPSIEVLRQCDIEPIHLRPKEGLALMNGTAVMTAIACLAYSRAQYLSKLSARITAMMSVALMGNANHFDELLFKVKPHAGQIAVARWIRSDLHTQELPRNSNRLQDRYSIRCAPHVIGVLQDSLPWMRDFIENELNSANDNPIIDGEGEHVMHGGHFYGGHIAFVMDSMKNCVANLADLMDRQMALLMDPKFNNGLPANVSGSCAERAMINHGFKAVQIGTSAWTAEALKLTMPASVFSRSTECHNQDKVSMGTIAARDCLRVLELTEQVASAALLAATQGLALRKQQGDVSDRYLTDSIKQMKADVFQHFDFLTEDRPLESSLRKFVELIQKQHWLLYK